MKGQEFHQLKYITGRGICHCGMLQDQKGYKVDLLNVKKTRKLPGLENYSY